MILVREVFQVKWGKANEAVEMMKQVTAMMPKEANPRLMTDAAGQFFTVVSEYEVASLAEFEKLSAGWFKEPDFEKWFARSLGVIESGRREFYTLQ